MLTSSQASPKFPTTAQGHYSCPQLAATASVAPRHRSKLSDNGNLFLVSFRSLLGTFDRTHCSLAPFCVVIFAVLINCFRIKVIIVLREQQVVLA